MPRYKQKATVALVVALVLFMLYMLGVWNPLILALKEWIKWALNIWDKVMMLLILILGGTAMLIDRDNGKTAEISKIKEEYEKLKKKQEEKEKQIEELQKEKVGYQNEKDNLQAQIQKLEETKKQGQMSEAYFTQQRELLQSRMSELEMSLKDNVKKEEKLKEELNDLKVDVKVLRIKEKEQYAKVENLQHGLEKCNGIQQHTLAEIEKLKARDKMWRNKGIQPLEYACPDDERIFKKIGPIFVRDVVPENIVFHFHQFDNNVLAQGDIEKVMAVTTTSGRQDGAARLLCLLTSYKGWFPCLLKVLRHKDVKQDFLADEMEKAIAQDTQTSNEESKTKTEVKTLHDLAAHGGNHEMEFSLGGTEMLQHLKEACTKNPRHENFIPVADLNLEHLPEQYRYPQVLDYIKAEADRCVLLTVGHVSSSRPQGYPLSELANGKDLQTYGCGYIYDVTRHFSREDKDKCPCKSCTNNPEQAETHWGEFVIITAAHLVFADKEAEATTCCCFYGEEQTRSNCPCLEPVKVAIRSPERDLIYLTCVTHDSDVSEALVEMCKRKELRLAQELLDSGDKAHCAVLVSFPHGLSKHVSVGEVVEKQRNERYVYNTASCPGCSGARLIVLGDITQKGTLDIFGSLHSHRETADKNVSIEFSFKL